jgi:putative peptidoglycan lipid II flippase
MRQAARFGTGTFISRIAGMTRDILMAATLGSGEHVAAFFMAFRFSNIMRRILGEGAMQAALVPVFEELRHTSEKEAALFFRSTWLAVSLVLIGIILLAEIALAGALFLVEQPQIREVIHLTMIMMPGLLFICWYGIQAALCTCYGSFFAPAAAPAAFNLLWIGTLLGATGWLPEQTVVILSGSIVLAYGLQWAAVLPTTWGCLKQALGPNWWRVAATSLAPLKRLIAPLTLGLVGVSATQLNSAMDAIFARVADASGPAYLWYSVRIEQVPVGMIGIALSSAALPALARCLQNQRHHEFSELVRATLVRSAQAMVVFSTLFLTMGYSLVELIFCRGAFCREAAGETTLCLWAYALGLIPQTWVLLLTPAYYAAQDYRRPSIAALWALGSNLLLNIFLVYGLGCGAVSIALATGVASLVNLWWLARPLPTLLSGHVWQPILRLAMPLALGAFCSMAMGIWLQDPTLSLLQGIGPTGSSPSFWWKSWRLGLEGLAMLAGFSVAGGWGRWRAPLDEAHAAVLTT